MAINPRARAKRVSRLRDANPDGFTAIVAAAETYERRRARLEHPAGSFDRAGRFDLAEPMHKPVRPPSRRFPYSELLHGRTLGHCAFLTGADEADTRAVVSLLDALAAEGRWSPSTPAADVIAAVLAEVAPSC